MQIKFFLTGSISLVAFLQPEVNALNLNLLTQGQAGSYESELKEAPLLRCAFTALKLGQQKAELAQAEPDESSAKMLA